jgi:hypothetical protein
LGAVGIVSIVWRDPVNHPPARAGKVPRPDVRDERNVVRLQTPTHSPLPAGWFPVYNPPMPSRDKLAEFTTWCQKHITGDEKGQAQIFLDRPFQVFDQHGCLDAVEHFD